MEAILKNFEQGIKNGLRKTRDANTVEAVVGRFGRCMDCGHWRPQGDRAWAKRGACDQYERAMTSYDSGCNRKFIQANVRPHVERSDSVQADVGRQEVEHGR